MSQKPSNDAFVLPTVVSYGSLNRLTSASLGTEETAAPAPTGWSTSPADSSPTAGQRRRGPSSDSTGVKVSNHGT